MRLDRCWFVPLLLLAVSACGNDSPPGAPTPTPAALVRVDIDGPIQHEIGTTGDTLQLRAVATLADGTRPDVTNEAAWSVTDPRVLTVSSRGLVTGVTDGATIVTALYRERAGATNVRVGPFGGRPFPVTGVVVDAEQGTPVADADIRQSGYEDESVLVARTDGNGFFSLGDRQGNFTFWATKFGYEYAVVTLGAVREATRVDIRLRANPGAYIERRMAGEFTSVDGSREVQTTLRIVTRAGGVFDAIVRSSSCSTGGGLQIFAESGGYIARGSGPCGEGARVRFVVPAPEVLLTMRGYDNTSNWQLTFREPR